MKRIRKVIFGASLAVATEVLTSMLASSIKIPEWPFLLAPAGLLVLLILAMTLHVYTSELEASKPGEKLELGDPSTLPLLRVKGIDPQVLKGRRQYSGTGLPPPPFIMTALGFLCLFGAFLHYANVQGTMDWWKQPAGSMTPAFVLCTLAVFLWIPMIRGLVGWQTKLIFSSAGIATSSKKGRQFIRWNQAANFRSQRISDSKFHLVADPIPGSDWFSGPWDYDAMAGVISLFDLTDAGINPAKADAAIAYWAP